MTHISQTCSEITLTFDRACCGPSVDQFQSLSGRLSLVEGVVSVVTRLGEFGCQQVVVFFQEGIEARQMLRRMAIALRPAVAPAAPQARMPESTARPVTPGIAIEVGRRRASASGKIQSQFFVRVRQLVYGTLAGGAFVMSWIGLIVPGIPTVPFVILTAYFAAKSSPAFHRKLREGRVFGPMIRDWETYHAVRPEVRRNGVILTLVIVGITLLVSPPSPALYALVGFMAAFSLFVIWQIPVLKEQEGQENESPATSKQFTVVAVA